MSIFMWNRIPKLTTSSEVYSSLFWWRMKNTYVAAAVCFVIGLVGTALFVRMERMPQNQKDAVIRILPLPNAKAETIEVKKETTAVTMEDLKTRISNDETKQVREIGIGRVIDGQYVELADAWIAYGQSIHLSTEFGEGWEQVAGGVDQIRLGSFIFATIHRNKPDDTYAAVIVGKDRFVVVNGKDPEATAKVWKKAVQEVLTKK